MIIRELSLGPEKSPDVAPGSSISRSVQRRWHAPERSVSRRQLHWCQHQPSPGMLPCL